MDLDSAFAHLYSAVAAIEADAAAEVAVTHVDHLRTPRTSRVGDSEYRSHMMLVELRLYD